ncbi:hypothetical protein [Tepidiforma thermophila]|uniref:Gram-positive cocci surface proteins LPxTG domain-containing protein n=1 Tax=Tepidiforma thermophila (strain KCTC 52669 / CGMCC 1.13589 / G233) TaxID=2761530 RepID=A0A2A9HC06_TEPT2|nr:hypothetical protein [Tepidiforma thermophila]PFG73494.1 hypothetical protein A9A59_0692 [Tepidiforma thermophila]
MTKVLKVLAGGWLAAVLGIALFAASGALGGQTVSAESPPNPPARFVGTVTVDGQPVPAGTVIEARIGNAACGVTQTFTQGGQARYVLDVPALDPGANPNCGVDGAVVSFYIGGKKAAESGTWRNYQLNELNLTYTTPTPAPSPTATPRPPSTGETLATDGGASASWLLAIAGLGILAFGVSGLAVARRAR